MNFLELKDFVSRGCLIDSFFHETDMNAYQVPGNVPCIWYAKINQNPKTRSLAFWELMIGNKKHFSNL